MNSELFYKGMSHFYDLIDVIYFRNYENSPRKKVIESIGDTDCVLDLCTGTATNAMRIAKEKPLTKVVGIDRSKDMLRVAKGKIREQNLQNIKLYCMDAAKMKFKDNCFDKILISLVLHETEEELADSIIAEAKRVLKEDGEIIVTEWERSKEPIHKVLFAPIEVLEPRPYQTFMNKNLCCYFEKHGLTVTSVDHCDYSVVLRLKKM